MATSQRRRPRQALTRSAVHACLQIDEVTKMVVAHLLNQDLHATVAAFARTSRWLFSTVVPSLWRELRDVEPMLRLIPQDVLDARETFDKSTSRDSWPVSPLLLPTISSKPVVALWQPKDALPSDWSRFELYTSHIQVLRPEDHNEFVMDPILLLDAMDDVLSRRIKEHGPLTPKLRQLVWPPYDVDGNIDHRIAWFLPETLARLDICAPPSHYIFQPLKRSSAMKNLRHFAFMSYTSEPATSEESSSALAVLRRAPALETLSLDIELAAESLSTIAGLSTLSRLYLWIREKQGPVYPTISLPLAAFPALRILALTGDRIQDILSFLSCVRAVPLTSVVLEILGGGKDHRAFPLAMQELQTYHTDTLIHLEIAAGYRVDWQNSDYDLPHHTTSFLLDMPLAAPKCHARSASSAHASAWPSLRTVKIAFPKITETMLRTFAFSTLVELQVVAGKKSALTLGALMVLAAQCPLLQRLTITLRGDGHPPSHDQTCPMLADLIYLDVTTSNIGDVHKVALFLWALCPRLTSVEFWPELLEEMEKWGQVSEYLRSGRRLIDLNSK